MNIMDFEAASHKQLGTFRTVLQRFGTEAMKPFFGKDVWAKLFVEQVNKESSDIILVPDFRFREELNYISNLKQFKIITIQVVYSVKTKDKHVSENGLKRFKFDIKITNTFDKQYEEEVNYELVPDIEKRIESGRTRS